jgi:uncharacterized protein with von Willebrand factor type A (vWA) domain
MAKKTKKTTEVQKDYILLDRSGSMSDKWEETLSSINAYVHELAKNKVNTEVYLAVFDYQGALCYDVLRENVAPSDWKDLTVRETSARGMTPLFDSVARIVTQANKDGAEKAAIIIMTDGAENSSRETSVEQAKNLLEQCRKKGWSVVFLGADFNAFSQGSVLGASLSSTLTMKKGSYGVAMNAMATTRAMYGSGGAATMSFSDEDQDAALGKKKG